MINKSKITERKHSYFNNKWFARWAPYYDLFDLFISKLRLEAARTIDLPPGSKILDVASGTGSQAVALAKENYDVIGIDLSPEMLNQAKKKTSPNLSLKFQVLDATRLPFKPKSFDGVSISLGLHDMPPTIGLEVLNEIKRVTKKGGKTLIVEHLEPAIHWVAKLAHPFIRAGETPNYIPFVNVGLERILQNSGLEISQSKYWRGLFQIVVVINP